MSEFLIKVDLPKEIQDFINGAGDIAYRNYKAQANVSDDLLSELSRVHLGNDVNKEWAINLCRAAIALSVYDTLPE